MADTTSLTVSVLARLSALETQQFGSVTNYSDITTFERMVLARLVALEINKFGAGAGVPDPTSFTREVLDRLTALEAGGGGQQFSTLSAPTLAFDSANGWTTGQNPPQMAITLPNDGSVQVGDWFCMFYGTSSVLAGATQAPWHQITSNDVLNGAIGLSYNWGVTYLPGGLTYFGSEFGRGVDASHITLTSPMSNIISDTVANPRVGFTASTSQPATINNSYSSATFTFTGIDFVGGGYAAVWVNWNTGGRTVSSVTLKGAGPSGADIALVSRGITVGNTQLWCCPDSTQVAANGSYNVVVVMNSAESWAGLLCGTITNTTTSVPTGTASLNSGSNANPSTTTSALTISSSGVGVAFAQMSGGAATANNGTQLAQGMSGYQSLGSNQGCISNDVTTGSWTPSFNQTSQNSVNILGLTWG